MASHTSNNTVLIVNLDNKECGADMFLKVYKEMIGMLESSSLTVTTIGTLEELNSQVELIKPKVGNLVLMTKLCLIFTCFRIILVNYFNQFMIYGIYHRFYCL